jgi:hypothetical protein
MKTQPYIEVDHVDKEFLLDNGEVYPVLKDIHLEIQKGEFVSLIGHSGCGKSTLLNGEDHGTLLPWRRLHPLFCNCSGFSRQSGGSLPGAGLAVPPPEQAGGFAHQP